jgi:hypothetical protein
MPIFFLGTLTRFYAESGGVGDVQRETDLDVIAGAVSAWRHWINKELPHSLDWNESPTAPFDRLNVHAFTWKRICTAADSAQVSMPRMWLPGEHDFLFEVRDLREQDIRIGSAKLLQLECELLSRLEPELAETLGQISTLARRSCRFRLPLVLQDD